MTRESEFFLASQAWLKPLSSDTMVKLKSSFKLFVILKDATISFHTQCDTNQHQQLYFLDAGKIVSSFPLEIIIGVQGSQLPVESKRNESGTDEDVRADTTPEYPPSLFFRINQQFYLVNHTAIDELSFPKDSSALSKDNSKRQHISTKSMPVATMKFDHLLMKATFPELCVTPSHKEDESASMLGRGSCDISRAEAVQRLAKVASHMNQTLKFSLLVNHPAILSDKTQQTIMRESASYDSESSTTSNSNSESTIGERHSMTAEFPSCHSESMDDVHSFSDVMPSAAPEGSVNGANRTEKAEREVLSLTPQMVGDIIASRLEGWAESLEEADYLVQPCMKPEDMAPCLLRNNNDNNKDISPDLQFPCMLDAGVAHSDDPYLRDAPNVTVLLQLISLAAGSSEEEQMDMVRTISKEISRVEEEAHGLLGTMFDTAPPSRGGDGVGDGSCAAECDDDDSGEHRRKRSRLASADTAINCVTSEANCIKGRIDDDDGNDEDDENDQENDEDDTAGPIPLSQFSHQEKRDFYGRIDALIEGQLSLLSQHNAALLAVLPRKKEFFREQM